MSRFLGVARGRRMRGTWDLSRAGAPVLRCPACGRAIQLDDAYHVDDEGKVSPEVICGVDFCTFGESVRLVAWGWEEDSLP